MYYRTDYCNRMHSWYLAFKTKKSFDLRFLISGHTYLNQILCFEFIKDYFIHVVDLVP